MAFLTIASAVASVSLHDLSALTMTQACLPLKYCAGKAAIAVNVASK